MRRPGKNILLLVICCLWFRVPPVTAGVSASRQRFRQTDPNTALASSPKCPTWASHSCGGGNNKRADINGLAHSGTSGGGSGTQHEREEERRVGGGTERDGIQGAIKVDDLRSESSDLRKVLEKQLLDFANRRHRSRSLEEEQNLERRRVEEPARRSNIDTDERYSIKDTLTMLRKILDDIERRLDSQPASDTVS